jgi:hypothetical protein
MITQTLAAVATVTVVAGVLVQLLVTARLGAQIAWSRRPRTPQPAPTPKPKTVRNRRRLRDYRSALCAARLRLATVR